MTKQEKVQVKEALNKAVFEIENAVKAMQEVKAYLSELPSGFMFTTLDHFSSVIIVETAQLNKEVRKAQGQIDYALSLE